MNRVGISGIRNVNNSDADNNDGNNINCDVFIKRDESKDISDIYSKGDGNKDTSDVFNKGDENESSIINEKTINEDVNKKIKEINKEIEDYKLKTKEFFEKLKIRPDYSYYDFEKFLFIFLKEFESFRKNYSSFEISEIKQNIDRIWKYIYNLFDKKDLSCYNTTYHFEFMEHLKKHIIEKTKTFNEMKLFFVISKTDIMKKYIKITKMKIKLLKWI
jgi:hypothetical protein